MRTFCSDAVALSSTSFAVPSAVAPLAKVTVPEGAPAPGVGFGPAEKVEVRVTCCCTFAGLGAAVSAPPDELSAAYPILRGAEQKVTWLQAVAVIWVTVEGTVGGTVATSVVPE